MTEEATLGAEPAPAPDGYMAQYDGFEKDWISTSALSLLMTCGIAFRNRYIFRKPEPGSVRQSCGVAVHKGREHNLIQKVNSKIDIPVDECTDAARDEINNRFDNSEIIVEPEYEGKSLLDARGIAVDLSVEIARKDRLHFHPEIMPTGVETTLAVRYDNLSRVIVGKVDVDEETEARDVIRDLKSGKRAFGQDKADQSMALATYGMLKYATTGRLPDEYLIDNVVAGKSGVKVNAYRTTRTLEQLQRQLNRFAAWLKVVDAGDFAPCNPEHWKCSEDWCGYWKQCPYGGAKLGRR